MTFIKVFCDQVTPEPLQNNKTKNNSKNSKSKKSWYGGFIFLDDATVKMKSGFNNDANICIFSDFKDILCKQINMQMS